MTNTHYIFHGKILPERADVYLKLIPIELTKPTIAQLIVKCERSQLVVEYSSEDQNTNLATLKNLVEMVARQLVDIVGYRVACAYNVDIASAYNTSTKEFTIFGVQEEIFDSQEDLERIRTEKPPAILEQNDQIINYEIMFNIIKTDAPLQFALAEFRESIKNPHYTAFYCARVIDALGESKFLNSTKTKKREKLQENLKIAKATIDKICKPGNIQRHINIWEPSWSESITWEKRKEQMYITWKIIRRYIMLRQYHEELKTLDELIV